MTSDLMTPLEHDTMDHLSAAARGIFQIIREGGDSSVGTADAREAAAKIHELQHMVLAQAAARAYPHRYRGLGGSLATKEGARDG